MSNFFGEYRHNLYLLVQNLQFYEKSEKRQNLEFMELYLYKFVNINVYIRIDFGSHMFRI